MAGSRRDPQHSQIKDANHQLFGQWFQPLYHSSNNNEDRQVRRQPYKQIRQAPGILPRLRGQKESQHNRAVCADLQTKWPEGSSTCPIILQESVARKGEEHGPNSGAAEEVQEEPELPQ